MSLTLFGCVAAALAGPSQDDWPQFLGPELTSTVRALESSFDWGEDGPEILWRTPTGPGYGGAAIRDGRVFLLDRVPGELDLLRVIDLESGEDLWDYGYDAPGRLQFPGSRSVPLVTESHVITVGGLGHVVCVDREARDVAWEFGAEDTYGGIMPGFGWSGSPVRLGDAVVVAVQGVEVGLVALDIETGEELWITQGVGYSHSTPAVLELLGKRQILFLSNDEPATGLDEAAPMKISSFDPADGSLLWQVETLLTRLPIPPPLRIDDEHLFLTGGYRGGSKLLKLSQNEGAVQAEEVFAIQRGAQIHAPILFEDHLYLIVNENATDQRAQRAEGGLLCLGLDGTERWRTGAEPNFGRGSLVRAGEHLLVQDGMNGTLRVVKASPAGYEEVASSNLFGIDDRRDHNMWAPMAIARGRILMRSQDELLCVRP